MACDMWEKESTQFKDGHFPFIQNDMLLLSFFSFCLSRRRIANTESYKLTGLYPDTLYYIWLAARSQRGEGATTPPIPVRTKQYGKLDNFMFLLLFIM